MDGVRNWIARDSLVLKEGKCWVRSGRMRSGQMSRGEWEKSRIRNVQTGLASACVLCSCARLCPISEEVQSPMMEV
jgi:hypothetical protein